jgi:hypothetical protein
VCTIIKGQDKLLVPKLDSLWKHVGQKKVAITSMGVVIWDLIFLKTKQHVLNEKYVQKGKDSIW